MCGHYYRRCVSVFPVSGGAYNRVCGRVTAYQYSDTRGLWPYHGGHATTIDDPYVDGVSLTHGSPRQHIWTFVAGLSEAHTQLIMVAVLVMLLLRYLYHCLLEETISVSQELTQTGLLAFNQMILYGMARTALVPVHVVHSTILHTSLSDFLVLQQMI